MIPTLETFGNRILLATKILLTFLVISILIFLNYLDLQESNRNRAYLCLLRDISDLSYNDDLQFKDFELERIAWLRRANPGLQKRYSDSRSELVDILYKYGASIGPEIKGKGDNPNKIVLMIKSAEDTLKKTGAVVDEHREPELDFLGETQVVGYGTASARSYKTVAMAIDTFMQYDSVTNVHLLVSFDFKLLVKRLDSILSDCEERLFIANDAADSIKTNFISSLAKNNRKVNESQHKNLQQDTLKSTAFQIQTPKENLFGAFLKFEAVYIQNNNIHVSYSDAKDMGSRKYITSVISIPAFSDSALFPAILEFVGLDTALVRGLSQNKNKLQQLRNLYGSHYLTFINDLSIEAFNKNNSAISMLGFDISRKWFPIAMFSILLFLYLMLFKTIDSASLSSLKIISGYESGDTLYFLIDNKWMRLIIWVLTPVFLLFLTLYSTLIHYSLVTYSLLILAGSLCLILGWLSYKKSSKI
jgi:hypothetical protein